MPKGIRGFRWIETGRRVWQLEDLPRHFRGCVSQYGPSDFRWHLGFGGEPDQGESSTKRDAMNEVERRIIPPVQAMNKRRKFALACRGTSPLTGKRVGTRHRWTMETCDFCGRDRVDVFVKPN